MRAKDVLGRSGEQAAAEYLESCGLRILDRNWRCAGGEIDIVAVERYALVVVEVKSRTGMAYGSPLEAALASPARHGIRTVPRRRGGSRMPAQAATRGPGPPSRCAV